MQEPTRAPLAQRSNWIRILYMILFGLVLHALGFLLGLVAVVQASATLATGEPFAELARFGRRLADYVRQVVLFLTYSTDRLPYPFETTPGPAEEGSGGASPAGPSERPGDLGGASLS